MNSKFKIIFFILLVSFVVLRFIPINIPQDKIKQPAFPCLAEGVENIDDYSSDQIHAEPSCELIDGINQNYIENIKPIFETKCLMCHGTVSKSPLYTIIPPISWLTSHDKKEAKKHIDMTYDFPFKGHHSLKENLEDLTEVIENNEMPPWYYIMMHWKSRLNKDEKKVVLKWIHASQNLLGYEKDFPHKHKHNHKHQH